MTPFLEQNSAERARPGIDWFAPLSGWFLVEMMRLEDARPGVLAHATRCPPLWRNAVAAALSAGVLHSPEGFLLRANGEVGDESTDVQIADSLMMMKHVDILAAAYSDVPPSLPAVLQKIGSSLLNTPDAYRRLFALLTSDEPGQKARARVLKKLDARLDDELIQTVEILSIGVLSPKTALAVRTATEAHKLNARIPVIQQVCSGATFDALRQSIEDAPHFRASNWVRGWLARADRLPPLGIPLDDDPGVVRIVPATARAMGREWQNCLAGHAQVMASGTVAYLAILDLSVLVVLTRTDRGWLWTAQHAKANFPVSADATQRVMDRLKRQGVHCFLPVGPPPELAGVFHSVDDLDFRLEGLIAAG